MSAIRGVLVNGTVVFDRPVDWPNGTKVVLRTAEDDTSGGMREEDWPTTPEGIEELLARWDAIEPLEFTPEEEADIAVWRQQVKEYTIANADKNIENLFP